MFQCILGVSCTNAYPRTLTSNIRGEGHLHGHGILFRFHKNKSETRTTIKYYCFSVVYWVLPEQQIYILYIYSKILKSWRGDRLCGRPSNRLLSSIQPTLEERNRYTRSCDMTVELIYIYPRCWSCNLRYRLRLV